MVARDGAAAGTAVSRERGEKLQDIDVAGAPVTGAAGAARLTLRECAVAILRIPSLTTSAALTPMESASAASSSLALREMRNSKVESSMAGIVPTTPRQLNSLVSGGDQATKPPERWCASVSRPVSSQSRGGGASPEQRPWRPNPDMLGVQVSTCRGFPANSC